MIIGVPKEIKDHETRVGLTPNFATVLREAGHEVLVETRAGEASTLSDEEYTQAGATIVSYASEVWSRADLVVKVKEPQASEYVHFRPGLILFTYLHLAPLRDLTDQLLKSGVSGVAYETIVERDGSLPLLTPMSEVAGRLAVQVGAQYLERPNGGRGILLGGVPGVAPANVAIIGGGVVGTNAAKVAIGMGAHVTIIDRSLDRLRALDDIFNGQVVTLASNAWTISETLRLSDLVIGGVLIPGASAPKLVRRDMIARMKRGFGRGRCRDRSGRLLRNVARDHPQRSGLHRRQRHSLLRVEHAGFGAAHLHLRADQRHFPVPARLGKQGPGPGGERGCRPSRGRQHVSRRSDASRRGGIADARLH